MAKERQTATRLEDIRDDHLNRYREAVQFAKKQGLHTVLDVGAGVGYGAYMMAKAGLTVTAIEQDAGAINHAREHFAHDNVTFHLYQLERFYCAAQFDLITAFEIIEHTNAAGLFLQAKSHKARYLIGSVPNQLTVPYDPVKHHYHVRHYTPKEIKQFLGENGWQVIKMGRQIGKHGTAGAVDWGLTDAARTILFCAEAAP